MNGSPDPISLFLQIGGLIAASGFIGLYLTQLNWRSTPMGKVMVLLAMSFAGMALLGIFLQVLGPEYPYRALLRNLLWIGANIALWWQLALLIRSINRPAPAPEVEDNYAER